MASILSSHSESVAFIPSASQWVFRNNSITGLYALVFIIAYRIVAGKRAWKSPRTFFLKED